MTFWFGEVEKCSYWKQKDNSVNMSRKQICQRWKLRRAHTADAWWWIYQQIFVHFLNFTAVPGCTRILSAIYLPSCSVTYLPDTPGQFIIAHCVLVFFNFKKKSKHYNYTFITFGGFGLLIQGAGLAPDAFSGAIDPDVGDHAGVTLRQTHVLLAHGLVEPGAEWSWCHVHLEEDRRRITFTFLITSRQI